MTSRVTIRLSHGPGGRTGSHRLRPPRPAGTKNLTLARFRDFTGIRVMFKFKFQVFTLPAARPGPGGPGPGRRLAFPGPGRHRVTSHLALPVALAAASVTTL